MDETLMEKGAGKSQFTRAQNSFIWSVESHLDMAVAKERFMNVKEI